MSTGNLSTRSEVRRACGPRGIDAGTLPEPPTVAPARSRVRPVVLGTVAGVLLAGFGVELAPAQTSAGGPELTTAGARSGHGPSYGTPTPGTERSPAAFPAPGERFEFDVRVGRLRAGTCTLATEAGEGAGDEAILRVSMRLEGGPFFFRIDDRQTTWIASGPFRSLRFEQHIEEGATSRHRLVVLDHAEGRYRTYALDEDGRRIEPGRPPARPMAEGAMDELAFLYYVRGLELETGRSYEIPRHFDPARNPMRVRVLGRQQLRTPAGTFETVVLQPVVPGSSTFGTAGDPRLYLSDDERRVVVRVTTRTALGPLVLNLKGWTPGTR